MKDIDREVLMAALAGEASLDELQKLESWRAADPSNEAEYQRFSRLWGASGGMAPAPVAARHLDASTVVAAARSREMTAATDDVASHSWAPARNLLESFRRSLRFGYRWSLGGVATLGIGILLGFWIFGDEPSDFFGAESFVTGVDEIATVTLQDETVVRLAPSTRLTILNLSGMREVSLIGRAYFAVTHDPQRPFRVRLSNGDAVEVLGTRFDAMSRAEEVQIAVAEGQVRLATLRNRVDLGANQVARIRDGDIPSVETVDDVYSIIDWLGPFLAFESTPMTDVAIELRQRFGQEIEILDAELAQRTVTGWFSDQPPGEIIGGICRVVAAQCTLTDGVYRMSLGAQSD